MRAASAGSDSAPRPARRYQRVGGVVLLPHMGMSPRRACLEFVAGRNLRPGLHDHPEWVGRALDLRAGEGEVVRLGGLVGVPDQVTPVVSPTAVSPAAAVMVMFLRVMFISYLSSFVRSVG